MPCENRESRFERFVREHEIPEAMWHLSPALKRWVRAHCRSHYVPEWLLIRMGLARLAAREGRGCAPAMD
jgi:hypothetical protein